LISIRSVRHRRFDPAQGIDFIKQRLEGIVGRDGYLHRLSRSPISAIEQLADCRNSRSLALCSQRQACQFDNNRRRMLARELITTLAFTKDFLVTVAGLFSGNIIAQRSWPSLSLKSAPVHRDLARLIRERAHERLASVV
jgi:hypothetical protein